MIWNCSAVDKLCFCMEDIFNHGLKEGFVFVWIHCIDLFIFILFNEQPAKQPQIMLFLAGCWAGPLIAKFPFGHWQTTLLVKKMLRTSNGT